MKKLQKFLITLFACSFVMTGLIGMTSCSLLEEVATESNSSTESTDSSVGGAENNTPNGGSNNGKPSGGKPSGGNTSSGSTDSSAECENHTWVEEVVVATCETKGSRKKYCSTCNEERQNIVLDKLGHDWTWGTLAAVTDDEGNELVPAYTGEYCALCEQKASEGLEYTLVNGAYYVKGVGNCRDSKIYIPSQVEKKDDNGNVIATYDVKGILGASTKFDGAFNSYSGITRLEVIGELDEIGKGAFSGCHYLEEVVFNKTVKEIGENTFVVCEKLANVEIAVGLEKIGTGAFKGCTSLTEIVLPSSMSALGDEVFSDCTSLEKVTIGSSVNSENNLTTSLKIISDYAFAECVSLKELVLGEGVEYIGAYAFSKCENLREINIPDSVKEICEFAFSDCKKAQAISLGRLTGNSQLTTIWESAFSNCGYLKVLNLPTSLKNVDVGVFSNANVLDEVHIADLKAWCSLYFLAPESNPLSSGKAFLYVSGDKVVDLEITSDITTIMPYAFYNYKNMRSLVIGENVTSIGKNAFANCENVATLKFNATKCSSLSLKTEAFVGMGAKVKPGTDVVIGAKVTKVPNYLFAHNFETDKFISARVAKVSFEEGSVCTSIGKYAFRNCTVLREAALPESVTTIGEGAFMYCNVLQNAIFSDSVTMIGASAYSDCRELKNVVIPQTISSIGAGAFDCCYSIEKVVAPLSAFDYINMDYVTDVTILDGAITESQFNSSNIQRLKICADVTSIGRLAFAYSQIKVLDLSEAKAVIGLEAFSGCNNLKSLVIGNDIKTIGEYAFYSCENLKELVIGTGVETIEAGAFEDTALEYVDFLDRIGWTVKNASGKTKELSSTILAEKDEAAAWLSETYIEYVWTKNS